MANTPLNSGLVFLYVTAYVGTGGVKKLLGCLLDSNISLSKNEIDASSKCGSFTIPGLDDQTFTATIQVLSSSDVGTATSTDIWASYNNGEDVAVQLADDDAAPTLYDVQFTGVLTQWNEDLPSEGAVTVQLTLKINGDITRNI